MKYIKIAAILTFCLFNFSVSNAQNKKTKKTVEQKSAELTNKLDKQVSLTTLQKTKVNTINIAFLTKKKTLNERIKALEKQKKQLKKSHKAQIKALLTEDQKKKLEDSKKKSKKKKK